MQVFEWELSKRQMYSSAELFESTIKTVELLLNGMDPMILFKRATKSYIGDDTNNFFDEVSKRISDVENNQLVCKQKKKVKEMFYQKLMPLTRLVNVNTNYFKRK